MYLAIRDAGMRAYITQIHEADEAVRAFLAGHLDDHPELLH
jgi:predicted Fe-Mo cluster-binding NifX family protein